ncbi:Multicopper oxidase, N-terminal [Dillenia turbinata]|uniref:laccase n=1 Tax=Dillenia turbinata TaxID=194707 RepID=A0AAN8ZMU2_9MAGN
MILQLLFYEVNNCTPRKEVSFTSFVISNGQSFSKPSAVKIKLQSVTRLFHTKNIVTVNGQFPGPRIIAREGDRLVIKVVNNVQNNMGLHTLHNAQFRQAKAVYTTSQWEAKEGLYFGMPTFLGLGLPFYGLIVILPKRNAGYPFLRPFQEVPIIFGEWWNADTETVINQALQTGLAPNVSDAYAINGLPGPLYNCSAKDTFKLKVKPGKTQLLRLIIVALNDELFFSIANHSLTVVEVDATYVKPFKTNAILLSPPTWTNYQCSSQD